MRIIRCSLVLKRKARAARKELKRILDKEATHAFLNTHFITSPGNEDVSTLATLRKSLRRVQRILDGRTR